MIVVALDREKLAADHLWLAKQVAGYRRFAWLRQQIGEQGVESDANLALWKAAEAFDESEHAPDDFTPYARTVITNRLRDSCRSATARKADQLPFRFDCADEQAEPLFEARDLLSVLEPTERAMLVAKFGLDGGEPMSNREISRRFGLGMKRVRSSLAEAITRLRVAAGI